MSPAVRPITEDDTEACIGIYVDAIHNGTSPHYSDVEREAWAPLTEIHDQRDWTERLATGLAFLAVGKDGPSGFIVMTSTGYLDLFFVRPAARGTGVAGVLYDHVLSDVRRCGIKRLSTHGSHLARRFLERRGWSVVEREVVERNGVPLERFEMALAMTED